ncbi:class I SAM-dependent methyltransferase [Flavobacteriaceae bacterium 3-367]
MAVAYDNYYKTENLFGEPYPELIAFFSKFAKKGKVLDLGCGQGRDAIPLARMGFDVVGIDNSKVGIAQMNRTAKTESLTLKGIVSDVHTFHDYINYDYVLLDSMFHFEKKDLKKETGLIKNILSKIKKGCLVVFCIQDTGKKVAILNDTINSQKGHKRIADEGFIYVYKDDESGHSSTTKYSMIVVEK